MFNDNPIIICGSGNSISDGLQYGLMDILKNHITIGLNYWYKHAFEPTFTTFVDEHMYSNNFNEFEKLNLIIGKFDKNLKNKHDNTILLPKHNTYFGKDSWRIFDQLCLNCRHEYKNFSNEQQIPCPKCGGNKIQSFAFYSGHLNGLFSLTLAIALGFKNVYLLGYDATEYKEKTHFFQDKVNLTKKNDKDQLIYHGVGTININGKKNYRASTFNNVDQLNNQWFKPYSQELYKINIINVSEISKINTFPKIDYIKFLRIIGKGNIDQNDIREEIRSFINKAIKKK